MNLSKKICLVAITIPVMLSYSTGSPSAVQAVTRAPYTSLNLIKDRLPQQVDLLSKISSWSPLKLWSDFKSWFYHVTSVTVEEAWRVLKNFFTRIFDFIFWLFESLLSFFKWLASLI